MLAFQVIVNIGMNLGLMPVTGITLPLMSYGGSSVLGTFLALGCCRQSTPGHARRLSGLIEARRYSRSPGGLAAIAEEQPVTFAGPTDRELNRPELEG